MIKPLYGIFIFFNLKRRKAGRAEKERELRQTAISHSLVQLEPGAGLHHLNHTAAGQDGWGWKPDTPGGTQRPKLCQKPAPGR